MSNAEHVVTFKTFEQRDAYIAKTFPKRKATRSVPGLYTVPAGRLAVSLLTVTFTRTLHYKGCPGCTSPIYVREHALEQAVRLVLALHKQPAEAQVPGFGVRLDPQAEKQLREALS